jgi:acetyl-CoA acetyltransferase
VVVGNMASGEFEGRSGIANALISDLALEPAYGLKVENTSGSGAAALYVGWLAIASGAADLALVAGGEKMTTLPTEVVTDVIASLTHPVEYQHGITLPSYAGLMARAYLERFGAPREALAQVAVKNHAHGALNPNAHFQKTITVEQALASPLVADPLRVYDFCPISDGAAALVLAPADHARRSTTQPIRIRGIAGATDTHVVHERPDLTEMRAVRAAAERAYRMAGLGPRDIGLAELHDMATILEIVQSEELGFFPRGEGWKAVQAGVTSRTGTRPINTSGGLKAKGHPIGATGVAQLVELTRQLQGRAGARQVAAVRGLACNVAGFANNVTVTIVERAP